MTTKYLSRKNIIAYGTGDLANGLTFGMSSTFLLVFYTDILGITAIAAGTLFFVARMIDAISDPLMGVFIDRWFQRRQKNQKAHKKDKFKPFLLLGCVPIVAASILLFLAPESLTQQQKLVWAYATYITWGMAYTFINIPYGSVASVMTQNPVERSELAAARGVGGALGAVIDRVVVPLFLLQFADQQALGYLYAMSSLGLLALVAYLICYFNINENVNTGAESFDPITITASLSNLRKNLPFIAVSIASLAMLAGFATSGAISIYYFRDNLQAIALMPLSGLTIIGPIFIAAPMMPKLIGRYGLKHTVVTCSLIGSGIFLLLLALPSNVYIYLVGSFIATLALFIPMMSLWSMISDCIDYNHYATGNRQEGAIYGAYSFVRKVAQAIAGFVAGAGLSLVNYDPTLTVQSAQTLAGIKFMVLATPAIGLLIAAFVFHYFWRLTPELQSEINLQISRNVTLEQQPS